MSRRNFDRPPGETRPPRPPAGGPGRIPSEFLHPEQRALVPESFDNLPTVIAKSAGVHPYLYRKRIDRFDSSARPGDLVAVRLDRRTLAGYGHFNPRAEITVRLLSWGSDPPDEAFWNKRLSAAIELRRDLLKLDAVTDAYRLIHAEGDGLSGIVVDKLGDVLSAEAFSLGMYQRSADLLKRLAEQTGARAWLVRPGPATLAQEAFEGIALQSDGAPPAVTIQEFGTRFRVLFEGGHKTGFFCDQRDNRRRLAGFCAGKSVLDLCCYTGGFALQAKKLGNAAEVTGVDLDEEPIRLARENAGLNQVRINFVTSDVFTYMRDMLRNKRQYDVVVLDPPKLIRTRDEFDEGRRKYLDLNRLAMQLVRPGGLLLSCTCSGLLDEVEFLKLLRAAAWQAGPVGESTAQGRPQHEARSLQILEKTGAAADHPVASNCPEGEYLCAVWMRVL
ncbi:MAG TPA: class I SAM-dependent rRNA methyltransferase [Planctomycetaceae bacterium]|jgi:23S rRNA (cytosine1962-C5)-methyltransferase|nr:class I SAM-dependent rRNA methyltransferase [Planctomycetaceae bacterium]